MNESGAEMIRVVTADDHSVFLYGLRMTLDADQQITVVGEAGDGRALIAVATAVKPDVILTDISMPDMDGIEAISAIRQMDMNIRCIALTTFGNDQLIIDALEAGAIGYINKNAGREEITEAVKTVYRHIPYYCKATNLKLARLITRSTFNPYNIPHQQVFSEREKQIIQLICQEKTSEEIGKLLFLSKRTVEGCRLKILDKMNVKTTAGLVIYAIKNGLYTLLE
ncbi:response regulator transcription factor [Ilyomonas limi]|uniref:Response regulator transcription factor n=1 Tax=Ilyomonas limi TaxID=2575867 RepID=A0A4U3KRG5_9BACT|nr:response regulator transcription factor [Ilyomonas limi]TKK64842.1 response regulator transcription factor [Ilyomonas limi]